MSTSGVGIRTLLKEGEELTCQYCLQPASHPCRNKRPACGPCCMMLASINKQRAAYAWVEKCIEAHNLKAENCTGK